MAFDIEVGGMMPATIRHRLAEIVGDDAVCERGGHVVITTRDQSAMIGVLHQLNDLGLDIGRIERT